MCSLPPNSLGEFSCLELKAVHMDLRDFIGVLPTLDCNFQCNRAFLFLEIQISRATIRLLFHSVAFKRCFSVWAVHSTHLGSFEKLPQLEPQRLVCWFWVALTVTLTLV